MKLRDYPFQVVQFSCGKCLRNGRYKKLRSLRNTPLTYRYQSLSKITKERTTIVIAHRLSTIKNADNIIVIDKGKIVESGKHENLLDQNKIYADLWNVQVGV